MSLRKIIPTVNMTIKPGNSFGIEASGYQIRFWASVFAPSFLLIIFSFFFLSSHLERVGREIVFGWLQGEAISIQEGNLLSSVTKHQRILFSSDYIEGVTLLNIQEGIRPIALIEVGEPLVLDSSLHFQT